MNHPNFNNRTSITYTVQDLAARYAHDLTQSFSAMRDCVLIGSSFGGVVAYELAQRLMDVGIMVKSMALLDSPWPGPSSSPVSLTAPAFLRNVFNIASSASPASKPLAPGTTEAERLHLAVEQALASGPPDEQSQVYKYDWQTMLALYVDNVLALRAYSLDVASKINIPCLYVKASHSDINNRCEEWGRILPKLSFEEVDAEHALVCQGKNGEDVAKFIATTIV